MVSSTPGTGAADAASEVRRARWIGAAALLPVLFMLALFGWRLAARGSSSSGLGINAVGQLAAFRPREVPPVTLRSLDGTLLSLPNLKGELVVLNFWGSWCVPCREEAPALERAARLTRETGVRFVGVNLWEPESDARQFIKEMGVTYTNVVDADGRLAVELGVTGIPETYFVSRDGQVVRRWIGPLDEQRILDLINELIAIP